MFKVTNNKLIYIHFMHWVYLRGKINKHTNSEIIFKNKLIIFNIHLIVIKIIIQATYVYSNIETQ